jgi:hypothetical protein
MAGAFDMRTVLLSLAALASAVSAAFAHPATEQFIPIGESTYDLTMQGEVVAARETSAESGAISMTVEGAPAPVSYAIGPATRIYLDRSALGRPNTLGSMDDLRPGQDIEVAIPSLESPTAIWIKIRTEE